MTTSTPSADLWIDTDSNGAIVDWIPGALSLTGYSARSLQGRLMQIMFLDQKPSFAQFDRVMLGHPVEREGMIRPRDRRGVLVRYRIELAPQSTARHPVMRWTFERI